MPTDTSLEELLKEAVNKLHAVLHEATLRYDARLVSNTEWARAMEVAAAHQKVIAKLCDLLAHPEPPESAHFREVDMASSVVEQTGYIPLGFQPSQIPKEDEE